ncbi:MAG: hypothetical protein A3J93_02275 [Candidatus Magasanikbacteria bacterium RIFOXYC2_FULL_42_28]|uniref:N-acetyltransferase domain-containing protein n=1 Tax=Candidatus Magasanikbacteria bacterium RIFOXYC2_FULL_42_28 TaxID=1798704 RepID=A0A1F6NVN2_9BACT|nr:MAG: hypothetical protein A3J93_02275 [Candidatus Magasanikbacteria bacterium RIFOXYC2_FULL_42_28]
MDKPKIIKNDLTSRAIKFVLEEEGKFAGRVYLYLIKNDLHDAPYGLLEDLFVAEEFRSRGFGGRLIELALGEAKKIGCAKIIGTSRHTRPEVHKWYKKLGFVDYGVEFRMNL